MLQDTLVEELSRTPKGNGVNRSTNL